jgi:hypothetical protein
MADGRDNDALLSEYLAFINRRGFLRGGCRRRQLPGGLRRCAQRRPK